MIYLLPSIAFYHTSLICILTISYVYFVTNEATTSPNRFPLVDGVTNKKASTVGSKESKYYSLASAPFEEGCAVLVNRGLGMLIEFHQSNPQLQVLKLIKT